MWIGYYSEAHDTFAPWFFQKDYGPSLGKGLRELGHICLAVVFILSYFITLDVLHVFPRLSVVRTGDREMRHEDEVKLGTYYALLLCPLLGFFLVEGGLIWSMRSAGQPKRVYSKVFMLFARFFPTVYLLVVVRMSLLIWRQSDLQSVMHSQRKYEK